MGQETGGVTAGCLGDRRTGCDRAGSLWNMRPRCDRAGNLWSRTDQGVTELVVCGAGLTGV